MKQEKPHTKLDLAPKNTYLKRLRIQGTQERFLRHSSVFCFEWMMYRSQVVVVVIVFLCISGSSAEWLAGWCLCQTANPGVDYLCNKMNFLKKSTFFMQANQPVGQPVSLGSEMNVITIILFITVFLVLNNFLFFSFSKEILNRPSSARLDSSWLGSARFG